MKKQRKDGYQISIGKRFGRLLVISKACSNRWGESFMMCQCSCGNKKSISLSKIRRGETKSCGCLSRELTSERLTKHGKTHSSIFNIWISMKARCLNKGNHAYKNYGKRGIKICKRWMEFKNFYKDMGDKPCNLSLDRINNNGNYSPKNCRWATRKEQSNNCRTNNKLSLNGKIRNVTEWASILNISPFTLFNRKYIGWSDEKILTHPIKNQKQ